MGVCKSREAAIDLTKKRHDVSKLISNQIDEGNIDDFPEEVRKLLDLVNQTILDF